MSPFFLFARLIERQNKEIHERQLQNANSKAFDFENFHTYTEVTKTKHTN